MPENNNEQLVQKMRSGSEGIAEVFSLYRNQLLKTIRFRLDTRLAGRLDPEDLLQEVWFDIQRRADQFVQAPEVPVLLWMRSLCLQVIAGHHRSHLGTQKRNARLEQVFENNPNESASVAFHLADSLSTPSRIVAKNELTQKLTEILESLEPIDREIITLRHLEELSNQECAEILGVQSFTASKRYLRAMKRLASAFDSAGLVDQSTGGTHGN